MATLREHKARLILRARRRLSRFTNTRAVQDPTGVAGPRTAVFGTGVPAGVQAPHAPRFVAAPAGLPEPALAVPAALAAGFSLPEPAAFAQVAQAAQALEVLTEPLIPVTTCPAYLADLPPSNATLRSPTQRFRQGSSY